MKYLFFLFILTFSSTISIGQNLYQKFDSTTKAQINLLSKKERIKFNILLQNRHRMSMNRRIDSIVFDYLFIEESFRYLDHTICVTEQYFLEKDTIPRFIFINGTKREFDTIYNPKTLHYRTILNLDYTFYPLLKSYTRNKIIQRVPYSKNQFYYVGCVSAEKKYYKANIKELLKSNYQIQTLIKRDTVKVSIQLPPRNPSFKIHFGGFSEVW